MTLTRDGRLANETQIERLARAAASSTDCFLFCHGWLYDEAEARQESARFFALLDTVLAPLGERIVPLRVGLHWPSKPFADAALNRAAAASGGLWPGLESRLVNGRDGTRSLAKRNGSTRRARDDSDLAWLIDELRATEIPASPEEEAELDALARYLAGAGRAGGPATARPSARAAQTASVADGAGRTARPPAGAVLTGRRSGGSQLTAGRSPGGGGTARRLTGVEPATRRSACTDSTAGLFSVESADRRSIGAERGLFPISPFHALSFWVMKRRAGEVGERFGRECLAPLWTSLPRAPRLHLVGHSFGGKLVTSIVLGGARPESVTLLLAAFSAFAFAPEIPGSDRPGFYYRVLAERRVTGPIVVLRSDHDQALGTFYGAITGSAEIDRGRREPRDLDKPRGRPGRMAAAVATSALGAVGARGVGAPEVDLVVAQQTGIPHYPIVNVDGSGVVKASDFLLGAHRDIFHREVAALVAMAAGVLVGGPDGIRPRPRDPLLDR